jgi:hypothetical protein
VKVVADTSPIHYLILIDQTDLLSGLFGRIFVPPAVEAELRHPSAPAVVRRMIAEGPDWLETVLFKIDPAQAPVVGLHAGERVPREPTLSRRERIGGKYPALRVSGLPRRSPEWGPHTAP